MTTHPPQTNQVRSAWVTLAVLVLVGCSPAVVRPAQPSPQAAALPSPTSTAALQVTQAEAPPSAPPIAPEPSSDGQEPTPTLRVGLQATDPQTVVLAAGKPQLVEFFAYW